VVCLVEHLMLWPRLFRRRCSYGSSTPCNEREDFVAERRLFPVPGLLLRICSCAHMRLATSPMTKHGNLVRSFTHLTFFFVGFLCICVGQHVAAEGAHEGAEFYLRKHLNGARTMSNTRAHCHEVTDWPNYEGRSLERCEYLYTDGQKSLPGLVYLLNPSLENIANRIEDACQNIKLGRNFECGERLAALIIHQNGGQFPVAGVVIERKDEAGGKGRDPVYLEFRDGTTVKTADGLNYTEGPYDVSVMEHSSKATIKETRRVARIADATRQDYYRAGGQAQVGNDYTSDHELLWPTTVRENELSAQDTGVDRLLRGRAMGLVSALSSKTLDVAGFLRIVR